MEGLFNGKTEGTKGPYTELEKRKRVWGRDKIRVLKGSLMDIMGRVELEGVSVELRRRERLVILGELW